MKIGRISSTPTVGQARPLYGFVQHPDVNLGREHKRHLVKAGNHRETLCGHPVKWLWDYATPLAPDCKRCEALSQSTDDWAQQS